MKSVGSQVAVCCSRPDHQATEADGGLKSSLPHTTHTTTAAHWASGLHRRLWVHDPSPSLREVTRCPDGTTGLPRSHKLKQGITAGHRQGINCFPPRDTAHPLEPRYQPLQTLSSRPTQGSQLHRSFAAFGSISSSPPVFSSSMSFSRSLHGEAEAETEAARREGDEVDGRQDGHGDGKTCCGHTRPLNLKRLCEPES